VVLNTNFDFPIRVSASHSPWILNPPDIHWQLVKKRDGCVPTRKNPVLDFLCQKWQSWIRLSFGFRFSSSESTTNLILTVIYTFACVKLTCFQLFNTFQNRNPWKVAAHRHAHRRQIYTKRAYKSKPRKYIYFLSILIISKRIMAAKRKRKKHTLPHTDTLTKWSEASGTHSITEHFRDSDFQMQVNKIALNKA